jgi:putative oxidoreductase
MFDEKTTPYAILLLRLGNGALLLAHGLMKVLVFTPAGTVGYFESIGLPGLLAYLTIIAEIGGGLALLAGLYTRLVSAALVPVLLGAAIFGHAGNGWVFSNAGGGWEYPVFWALVLGTMALLGDGAYSAKSLFARDESAKLASQKA